MTVRAVLTRLYVEVEADVLADIEEEQLKRQLEFEEVETNVLVDPEE